MKLNWLDDGLRYGLITRLLHWTMAALLAWQFTGMAIKLIVGRGPALTAFWVGTHIHVGTLLFTLAVVRALWGLYNLKRRPPHEPGLMGRLAVLGHLALYGFLLGVPALALLRAFGSGRGFSPFGIELAAKTGVQVPWMTAPASLLHGLLAWTLLAMIVGHILMALAHHFIWRDDSFGRIAGRSRPQAVAATQVKAERETV